MMRPGKTLIYLIIVLIGYSCAPAVRIVETEAENDFDLSQYQTYNFSDALDGGGAEEVMPQYVQEMNILKAEIARELEERGLRRSPEPELLVNIGAVVEEKVQTRQTDIREAPLYIGQRRYHWEAKEVEVGRYQHGTVSVHLIDREENKLMWRGVAEGVLPKDREKLHNRIEQGVEDLFAKVPSS